MSRPLNFLHLTTFYPPYSFGGDAIYVHRLAHALGDAGHIVDVIHCVDSFQLSHTGPVSAHFADHPMVGVHGLRSGWKGLSPLLTQQTGRPFLKRAHIQQVLDGKHYDVIHFHNISLLGPDVLALESKHGASVTAEKVVCTSGLPRGGLKLQGYGYGDKLAISRAASPDATANRV